VGYEGESKKKDAKSPSQGGGSADSEGWTYVVVQLVAVAGVCSAVRLMQLREWRQRRRRAYGPRAAAMAALFWAARGGSTAVAAVAALMWAARGESTTVAAGSART
jgi:hypothetical protein